MNDRIFAGVYPTGIVYYDRKVEENGDYKRLAFLSFRLLELAFAPDCPYELRPEIEKAASHIQWRIGEEYPIDSCGHTVTLGCDRDVKLSMRHLPVRKCSIVCSDHPEWGTFGVMEDKGLYYDIFGRGGWRTLSKDEAAKFWKLAHNA